MLVEAGTITGRFAHKGHIIEVDPHRYYAADIFGVLYEEVTPEQRAHAKMRNYIRAYTNTGRIKP